MLYLRLALPVAVALLLPLAGRARVARPGFNDVTGLNGDGALNDSPFNVGNAPLGGGGWQSPAGPAPGRTPSTPPRSAAARSRGTGRPAFQGTGAAARALAQPLAGVVAAEVSVKIQSPQVGGNGVSVYL